MVIIDPEGDYEHFEGAITLGKLNMTEAAYAENHPDYAPAINPWRADMWTGVSSK